MLKACRREKTARTPVWLMRQAGRYMPEYRKIRDKVDFLTLCKTPHLAAEVTVLATQTLDVDAAIIFSDILLLPEALGSQIEFSDRAGPVVRNPVRTKTDIDSLGECAPEEKLHFVFEAIRLARAELPCRIPLIGFAGGPFTLASYLIEGGSSRDFNLTRRFMRDQPREWQALLSRLSSTTAAYVNSQIEAGAQIIQIFDTWVGCLSPAEYGSFVLPHLQQLFSRLPPGTPAIHFGTTTGHLLALMKQAGASVMGIDWRTSLKKARSILGPDMALQGNLNPAVLLENPQEIRRQAAAVLADAGDAPGHIFNLGHGVLPQTPLDHVKVLVEFVKEHTCK